jgi:hypothetical protein
VTTPRPEPWEVKTVYSSIPEDGPIVAAARAVLADYKAALASAPLGQPPGRDWMLKLASALGSVLDALDDGQADGLDDEEPYCYTCGSPVGIFHGHGDGWHHWRGQGTAASPVELVGVDHEADVAWRPAGAR